MIGSQCRDKGLRWSVSLPEKAGKWFVGDDMRLKEVLINILGNAVKFTPEGGEVRLSAELVRRYESKSAFRFVISDTGIGMGAEFLGRLFEPFSQEDFTTKTKYGSTGLGMSITKSIVEMMNGEISVESEKGRGSTFTVTLTLDDSEREDEPSEADGVAEGEGEADLSGIRVLVAEDVDVNAEILQAVLEMRGIESDRAENGRIAVERFAQSEEGHYAAILMDMRMPEMDGLEATRAIRALPRADAKSVPIVALTANAFDEDVQRSLQSGLNAHLSKPIDPDSLFGTLGRLVSRRGA
jgi:CheY-like chemotaxis protein